MDRLHNPFTPGAGSLPPELAGRSLVIEDGRVAYTVPLFDDYIKRVVGESLEGRG